MCDACSRNCGHTVNGYTVADLASDTIVDIILKHAIVEYTSHNLGHSLKNSKVIFTKCYLHGGEGLKHKIEPYNFSW